MKMCLLFTRSPKKGIIASSSRAFEETGLGYSRPDRLGIIVGSLIAGIAGFVALKMSAGTTPVA
jgi:Na+/H+ antiporter NhaA